jgi:sugar O-acyltransferase (sialic acid O-acetyltransferase NeuD family)
VKIKRVAVAGNGQAAEILLDYLSDDERYEVVTVIADQISEYDHKQSHCGFPLVSVDEFIANDFLQTVGVFMAVGYRNLNRDRDEFFRRLRRSGVNFLTYVHPQASVSNSVHLGSGSIVLAGSVIEPFVKVGENSVIWNNCTIAHHAVIGDSCWIAAGAIISGHAHVEKNCFVGIGSTVSNRVTVSEFSILGAGVLATRNVSPQSVLIANSSGRLNFTSERYEPFLHD